MVRIACATASSACGWPTTRRSIASLQVEHGADLVRLHAAGRDAGPALDDLGDRLAVDHRKDQRLSRPAARAAASTVRRSAARCAAAALSAACSPAASIVAAHSRRSRSASVLLLLPARRERGEFVGDARRAPPSVRRAARRGRRPAAISRSRIATSVSISAMRRWRSSIGGGTAAWLIATRAQAVSIRLTALSGSWRRRDVARRQPHRLAHRLVEDAHVVVLLERGDQAAHHGDRHRLRSAPRPSPPGSGGSAPRPSRSISCIRPRWSRRSCAARRAPAPASAGWRHRSGRPRRRRRSA